MKKSSSVQQIHSINNAQQQQKKIISWLEYLIPPFILTGLTALFYYPSLRYSFQFDDIANIQKVFNIRSLTFTESFFSSARWIPFWLNAVNYRMGQFNPYYYRLFNVGFHIVAGILVFYTILRALSNLKKNSFYQSYCHVIAYIAAFLFLLHPVQTQTVSYVIQGRMEGLAGLSVIAMVFCFLSAQQARTRTLRILFLCMLFFAGFIGCGTKEIVIVAPFLLLVTDWFFVAQGYWHDLKKRLLLHGAFTATIFGIYAYFLKPSFFIDLIGLKIEARNNIGNLLTEVPGQKILPLHFFISQFKVIVHYIWMFFWPFTMSVEYDWKLVKGFFALDCFLPFCMLVALAMVLMYRLRKDNIDIVTFCALWFFIAIAPRSSIIPSSELLADYKTYLASVGMMLFLALILVRVYSFVVPYCVQLLRMPIRHSQALYVLATLCAVPLGYSTYARNKVWRSSEEFWSNIIENAPGKARAYNNLAVALSEKGRLEESIPLYKKAIAMDKNYPDPRNNLAVAYSMTNKLDLAIETMQQVIRITPHYPEAYNNLASFYIAKKDYDKAEEVLNIALDKRPHYGKAHFNLGKISMERGHYDKALQHFKNACTKADLDNESGYTVYANAALQVRKYDDAIEALTKLIQYKPNALELKIKLAQCYFATQQYQEAINWYKQLVALDNKNGLLWYNLGDTYLHMKNPALALQAFEKAYEFGFNTVQTRLSIIACLQQQGRLQEAERLLMAFVNDATVPAQFKQAAQLSLNKMREHYRAITENNTTTT